MHAILYPFELVMTVMCPVYNGQKEITKILVGQLDIDKIWNIVERKSRLSGGQLWLIDNKGIVISSPDKEMLLERFPDPQIYEHAKLMTQFHIEHKFNNKKVSYFLNPIHYESGDYSPNWNVLFMQDSDVVNSTIIRFRRILFIRGIISLLLVIFLGIFFSRNLSSRILKLRDATVRLSEGNYSLKIEDKGSDEVSDLIKSFTYAQNQIQISEQLIKDTNERFELAVEGAKDVIWDWNLLSNEIYFAPKWFEIIGSNEGDANNFIVEDWYNLIHFEDLERFKDKLRQIFKEKGKYFEEEYRILGSDNTIRWIKTRGIILYNEKGIQIRMAGSHSDITESKQMQQKVTFYAYYDSLTELPNRTKLLDRLNQALNRAIRKENYSFCILFLDFDGFKHVNDTYGHAVGDLLLISISKRLKECVRPLDMVSRIGGDEFIILLDGIQGHEIIEPILKRILEASRNEFRIDDHSIFISVSIGIIVESEGTSNSEDLIQKADIAMYYSKMNGKNKYTFFKEDLQKNEVKRWSLEHELHNALGTEALKIYYQPIIDPHTKEIFSFEALEMSTSVQS